MAKASTAAKNRYNKKAYDRLSVVVPKGRREDVMKHAESKGKSVNSLLNELLLNDMGLTKWKGGNGE